MNLVKKQTYKNLVADITQLYISARMAMVKMYWETGRRIVEFEQNGEDRAKYGTHLLETLSAELTQKCGKGFLRSNLWRMRQFYCANKILARGRELSWDKHKVLITVNDDKKRKWLEKKAIKEKLTAKELRQEVKKLQPKKISSDKGREPLAPTINSIKPIQLKVIRNPVHIFEKLSIKAAPRPKGEIVIDCGFHIWRTIKKDEYENISISQPSYTFPATVISIIDGDTIWARIDCGFGTQITEKLRFKGIDTPELPTPEGKKAKRFVVKALPINSRIVIHTHTSDKYDRYLADIFYLPSNKNTDQIVKEGKHLNQELLDQGFAVVW